MMNQQPTQLDPALTALITLQQRANPTTPNGQPTVAAKLSAQAGQGIAGMMPPEGEQERGLPGIIASAQQAMPSVAQNAQQGQMDQMAQQVAQRMQQQQQPPGVTGLPTDNMGFAEGGIIPTAHFAEGGNEGLTLGSMPQVAKYAKERLGMGIYDSKEDRARKLELAAALMAVPKGETPREFPAEFNMGITAPTAPAPAAPRQAAPRPASTSVKPHMTPSTEYRAEYGAGFAPANSGIASGMFTPAPSATNPDIEAARASTAEMAKLMKERPDFLAQELAALNADKQARAAAAAKQKDRQGFEALMNMFAGGVEGGMGGMGRATTAFNREIATRENAAREADRLDALLRVEKSKAAYALKIGDTAALLDARKNIAGMQHQMDQVAATLEGYRVQARGQDIVAGTAREHTASQERIAANRDRTTLEAAQRAQDNKQEVLDLQRFRTAISTGKIAKLSEKMISLQGISTAKPLYAETFKEYRKAYNELAEQYNQPLLPKSGSAASSTGAPLPPAVAAALAKHAKGS